jgi:hypothetical protein
MKNLITPSLFVLMSVGFVACGGSPMTASGPGPTPGPVPTPNPLIVEKCSPEFLTEKADLELALTTATKEEKKTLAAAFKAAHSGEVCEIDAQDGTTSSFNVDVAMDEIVAIASLNNCEEILADTKKEFAKIDRSKNKKFDTLEKKEKRKASYRKNKAEFEPKCTLIHADGTETVENTAEFFDAHL